MIADTALQGILTPHCMHTEGVPELGVVHARVRCLHRSRCHVAVVLAAVLQRCSGARDGFIVRCCFWLALDGCASALLVP